MVRILKVTGKSLWPVYKPGDFVIISKIPLVLNRLKIGDVVVFNHPLHGTMVKRIEKLDTGGRVLWVTGSHENSLDSRQFGEIPFDSLKGKVIFHFHSRN